MSKFDLTTQKRAIPKEEIIKIMTVDLSKEQFYIQFSRDIFIFNYLCSGINFTDIASLKFKNLIENKLVYVQKKTKKKIKTPLSDEALQIIQKYAGGRCAGSSKGFRRITLIGAMPEMIAPCVIFCQR